ncbi:MAG: FtsX-like permease family protein [Myxococcales bacterium]|nr:FtsX-like permease family protein [Myxococcales bacterium]
MTLAGLAVRNLARNKFRVLLTIAGVGVFIVLFLLLRTVLGAWSGASEGAAKDRVVTRHKVTFVMALPKRYVEQVRQSPHVKKATWANWFGGKDPKHDREFFSTLAADPATYFDVYDEVRIPSDQLEAWKHDRQGAIVGDVLAKKLGWSLGDKVTLQSGIYPGEWQFTIDGIYTTSAKSVDRSTLVFQWDYLNDSLPPARRDMVGWVVSRVDDPRQSADVGVALDKAFESAETPTLSQDERSFNASFMAMFSAVLKAMDIVSAVILAIMMLILGNTIAMGVRERTGEYGVLRAIGFLPGHVALWIVAESLAMGLLGGLLGVAIAWPLINLGIGRFIEENMGNIFPFFRIEPPMVILALFLAALLGAAAAAVPAWRASRLRVVDAVRRVA